MACCPATRRHGSTLGKIILFSCQFVTQPAGHNVSVVPLAFQLRVFPGCPGNPATRQLSKCQRQVVFRGKPFQPCSSPGEPFINSPAFKLSSAKSLRCCRTCPFQFPNRRRAVCRHVSLMDLGNLVGEQKDELGPKDLAFQLFPKTWHQRVNL